MVRMENDRIGKKFYVGVCVGSHSMGRLWKSWSNIIKNCLKKIGLAVKQARRMVHHRSVW